MASKKGASNAYVYNQAKIDRLIRAIDHRAKTGADQENVNPKWNRYTLTKEGDRVWTY